LFAQKYGGFITLDAATYYVSEVPVSIDFLSVLLLNMGTLVLCFMMLLIPSMIITKIQPSKSIKFT
jgi:lipoprotein-releasing system permease protein